ncbi:hypothetical protein [Hydrogenophaga sp.]|uniref:hypothetical protein n=1 Tax=Hydrogenophaga sp. TaxID=1904254 RepID=UPI002720E44F|nr:hypothetical protein [Hydrogenophaga sp.]MDO9505585.1 hypothetical protein [Hydrogenophaga sp.]MDP2987423.1 hypothetical protein [Hydrogenophaga sp.]MDP3629051.1 hypothetical protein [Hydrogenophaga sp.]
MKPHGWHLVIGLTLWFAWFCATYGGLAVACAVAPPPAAQGAWTWLNAAVLLLAAACTVAFSAAAWWGARTARRLATEACRTRPLFFARASTALYATAAVSTALVALPAVLLAPCV